MKLELKKLLLLSIKIGVGASAAIYIAERLHLQFAASAGIITLLTLITTKWGTLKLSLLRILTYALTIVLFWGIFHISHSEWVAYGVFLFVLVMICEKLEWRNTLSVNAVIGTHLLTTQDFSLSFIWNEFLLVVIGIAIAVILNLFHINNSHELGIIRSMRYVEQRMQRILEELAGYLEHQKIGRNVWKDIISLENELEGYVEQALEYQNNTFHSHPSYYIYYFEMRLKQCGALHNLHSEMKSIREIPKQASVIATYIKDLKLHVTEMNDPQLQIRQLEEVLEQLKEEPLPVSFEEFENKAKLYHIMMDLEEFLMYKKRFIESIDARQFRIYWKKEVEGR